MAMEGKRERPEEDRQKPEDGMDLGTFLPSVKHSLPMQMSRPVSLCTFGE